MAASQEIPAPNTRFAPEAAGLHKPGLVLLLLHRPEPPKVNFTSTPFYIRALQPCRAAGCRQPSDPPCGLELLELAIGSRSVQIH